MEVKEDPKERQQQIYAILENPDCKVEESIKLYEEWNKYYDEVQRITFDREFLIVVL